MTRAALKLTNNKVFKLEELECRVVKQECFNGRNFMNFLGISNNKHESPEDTEAALRNFLHKQMNLPKKYLEEIELREFTQSKPEYVRKK